MKKISILIITLILMLGCDSPNNNWVELFNGENFEGWHSYNRGKVYDGWYIENEEIRFDYTLRKLEGSSYLVTDNAYTSFELSLEWKISEHGNSGVFWSVVEDEAIEYPYITGPEIQILDDNWTEYVEGRGDINRAGSLYNLLPPTSIVSKGAGLWNHFLIHIDHIKNVGFVEFNDVEVVRFPVNGPEWDTLVANSLINKDWVEFGKAKSGHISLQDHGGTVAFRNIKIRTLE